MTARGLLRGRFSWQGSIGEDGFVSLWRHLDGASRLSAAQAESDTSSSLEGEDEEEEAAAAAAKAAAAARAAAAAVGAAAVGVRQGQQELWEAQRRSAAPAPALSARCRVCPSRCLAWVKSVALCCCSAASRGSQA